MATIKEYLDYAELAQASYSNLQKDMFGSTNSLYVEVLKTEFSETQAKAFADRYTVKAVYNDPNGFSATLFQDGDKLILSLRGTDQAVDVDDDAWLTTGKLPPQYESMITFFKELQTSSMITTESNLVVTGHSLGGALTQMLTATYPEYVDEAYTYNSPGAATLRYKGQTLFSNGLVFDSFIAYQTFFTCKTFSISKALHVKNKIQPKEASCELQIMVA